MITVNQFLADQTIFGNREGPAPEISLVLPTYSRNKNGMLKRSIESVLNQTFRDFELLVIDDGSVDGSSDLIESFRAKDARIIHVRHERNSGIHSIRLNEGIELARGKYLGFQFDDDELLPNALKDLHREIIQHHDPIFVLGHSDYQGPNGEWSLPQVEINLVTLYEQNRFGNNAVLFPRDLVSKYGMYDCHIGMRRLCDWDLWLRFIKHVPFRVIPQHITRIYESNVGSLGLTVPFDLSLFYYIHAIPRDHLLTPDKWHDYPIDSLQIGDVEFTHDIKRRLYEDQIGPYYGRFRHHFPEVEGFSATYSSTPKHTILITKQSYDTCNDVTLTHYDAITHERGTFKSFYQPLAQISDNWKNETDMLLLLRAVETPAHSLISDAYARNIPIGYYLDDDLLTFFEYGHQFDYLAPGTPLHNNLQDYIQAADAVLVTNQYIANSVRPINPRVIPHNNSIPAEFLPNQIRPRDPNSPLRIGYVGQSYRIEEFRQLWECFVKISREFGNRIEFEFWGLDISELQELNSPVKVRPFNWSYLAYLELLQKANFDILVTPLLDTPRPRLGKSLIKYYETAVANALGIFSDVPQYASLQSNFTCLKAKNTPQDWEAVLRSAIEMPASDFDGIRARCLEHVREEFTNVAQIHLHEAALRAVEFHSATRSLRHADGCPRVMYVLHSVFFGGGEIQLWRRLLLARKYGIEPIVVMPTFFHNTEQASQMQKWLVGEKIQVEFADYVCFTEPHSPLEYRNEAQRENIRALLERCRPALVHSVTFIPSLGQICTEMNIPHVATQYAIRDSFEWEKTPPPFKHCDVIQSDSMLYASRWSELLSRATKICARDMAPQEAFNLGQQRYLTTVSGSSRKWPPTPIRMVMAGTFQERKQQFETIQAVGRLVHEGLDIHLDLYGYLHYFPDYVKKCSVAIQKNKLEGRVTIYDFSSDITKIMENSDVLLSLSTFESFPGAIKDAIASGVLVVATPVGGVKELILDGISGLLCANTSEDALVEGIRRAAQLDPVRWHRIVEQARKVARSELHPARAANDLFEMYNLAIRQTRQIASTDGAGDHIAAAGKGTRPKAKFTAPIELPGGAVYVGAGLHYRYQVKNENWNGLGIFVGTSMRSAQGQLVLQIYTSSGILMRAVDYDLSSVHDNEWVDLAFPTIRNSAGHIFRLDFRIQNKSPQTLISIYESRRFESKLLRGVRRLSTILRIPLPGMRLYAREWHL